jgi:hypothetical protein
MFPLVCTSMDAYSVIYMGLGIFKDPSLLGAYHGVPPILHPSAQVCVVSSNGTYTKDTIPSTEASPHIDVPPVEEPFPGKSPENPTTPLIPNSPPCPPSRGKFWFGRQFPKPLPNFPYSTPHLEPKHSR